jgi:hypothetical protein
VINNVNILTLESTRMQVKRNMITNTIYPETDNTYDLGIATDNEWRNVYTENIFVSGQQHHSDRRIKDNIIDLPNDKGLSFIQKLRPVQFTYKKSTNKRKHWGFIAQEIRQAVGSDDYSIWGEQQNEFKKQHISPTEFLSPIVKSIQELYGLIQGKQVITQRRPLGVEEHKQGTPLTTPSANNETGGLGGIPLELITQLNSYEIQLLENENKIKKMDKFLEEVIEDKEKLEINNILFNSLVRMVLNSIYKNIFSINISPFIFSRDTKVICIISFRVDSISNHITSYFNSGIL